MVLGLQSFTQRTGEGAGQPILDADNGEQLMYVQPAVAIVLGNRAPESPGTLYISTKRIVWLSDVDMERGYAVGFLSVSLHAVSRDPEAYSLPCIYTQIETDAGEDEESEDSGSECEQTLDVSKITEMRLVPSDPNQLDSLFDIFCQCAELNPEPEEEEEEHNWIFSADQMPDVLGPEGGEESEWQLSENPANPIGYSNGDHDLSHSVLEENFPFPSFYMETNRALFEKTWNPLLFIEQWLQLQIDDQRFDDAEEMEHDTRSSHQ